MAPSTAIRGDDGIHNLLEPRLDLNHFMMDLCEIFSIQIDGRDISSQSFGDWLLGNFRSSKVGIKLIGDIAAQLQSLFQFETRRAEQPVTPTTANLSNDHTSIITSASQHSTSPYHSTNPSCSLPTNNPPAPTSVPTQTDTPQNGEDNYDNETTAPALPPQLLREGHHFALPSLEELGQAQSTNQVEVGVEDNLFNELIEPPPRSSSRVPRPRKPSLSPTITRKSKQVAVPTMDHVRQPQNQPSTSSSVIPAYVRTRPPVPTTTNTQPIGNKSRGKKVGTGDAVKKNLKRTKPLVSRSSNHAPCHRFDGFFHCVCKSKFASKAAQKRHIQYFNGVWKFQCDHCHGKFYTLPKLKIHLKKQHGKLNPLEEYVIGCHCGKMFKTREDFEEHKKNEHKNHWEYSDQQLAPVVNSSRFSGMSPRGAGMSPRRPSWMTTLNMEVEVEQQDLDNNNNVQHQNDVDEMSHEACPISSQGSGHTEVVDLVSENEEEKQIHRTVGSDVLFSSMSQGIPQPLPPQTDQQLHHPNDLINGNERENGKSSEETSVDLNMQNGRRDYLQSYGCENCSQAFRALQQLRKHQQEEHQSNGQYVRCNLCDSIEVSERVFGSSKSFHTHRAKHHRVSRD